MQQRLLHRDADCAHPRHWPVRPCPHADWPGARLVTFHGVRGGAITDGAAASGNTDRAGQLAAGHRNAEATRDYNHVSPRQRADFAAHLALDPSWAPAPTTATSSWHNRPRLSRAKGWLANASPKEGVVAPGHYVLYEDRATGTLMPAYMLTSVQSTARILSLTTVKCLVLDRSTLFRFDRALAGAPRQRAGLDAVMIGGASRQRKPPPPPPAPAPTTMAPPPRQSARWLPRGRPPWFLYLADSGHYMAGVGIAVRDNNDWVQLKFRGGHSKWGQTRGPAGRILALTEPLLPLVDTLFDTTQYVGSSIAKSFQSSLFLGQVAAVDESDEGLPLFQVEYVDGDSEDLDFGELCQVLLRMGPATPPLRHSALESAVPNRLPAGPRASR